MSQMFPACYTTNQSTGQSQATWPVLTVVRHSRRLGCRLSPPSSLSAILDGMDRRDIGAWLTTPGQAPEALGQEQDYRGQDLGLPQHGTGSVAAVSRRVVAIVIDWAAALLIASLVAPNLMQGEADFGLVTLAIFAIEIAILTWLTGSSFGQRITSVSIVRTDHSRLGIVPVLVRTALLCLVIPALIWDRDTRGLHDKAARTVCIER